MIKVKTAIIFCRVVYLCYTESMKKAKKKEFLSQNGIYIYLAANKRLLYYAFLWGVPFAVSCVLGRRLVHEGTVFGAGGSAAAYIGSFLLFLLETAALSVPAAALAGVVLRGGGKERGGQKKCSTDEACAGRVSCGLCETQEDGGRIAEAASGKPTKTRRHRMWRTWLFYSLLIFLCWLPIFLAYYPSVFAYDAEGQLYQVIAKDYSTHHPLLHTLFLGAFFRLGGAVGSYQTGMAVHSVVQMILMAAAFGWAISRLYERGTPRWVRVLLLLFYGLFPANSILALSTTKDVLFAALVLVVTLKGYCLAEGCSRKSSVADADGSSCNAAKDDRGSAAVYVLLAVLMLLFRNNAVYAFVVSVPVIYFALGKGNRPAERRKQLAGTVGGTQEQEGEAYHTESGRSARKRYLCTALLVLVLFCIGAFLLKAVTHAQSGSPRELLSVPLQQMARVRVEAEEQLDPAMRQELDKYIPKEWVFAAYDPHLADPVKNRAVIHDDPKGLIKTWVRLGLRFPTIYADAFLDNSLGMWYLWDTSHAQVYGIGTESGFGWLSTDNRTMPAGCEIVEKSFLPGLRAFMERIVSDNSYQKLPIVRLLFAPALYWWLLWLCLVAALYRKRGREALPMVFLITYYLTLLLSPTVIVRYLYPLVVTVPVIFPIFLLEKPDAIYENTQ